MPNKPFRILSTKNLSPEAQQPAMKATVQLDMLDFIALHGVPIPEAVAMQRSVPPAAWVILTSAMAPGVLANTHLHHPWKIACLEGATMEATRTHLGSNAQIEITAHDATTLAEKIIQHGDIREVYFFCGDQRRDTIPQRLQAAGITVHEKIIYHNTATPHQLHDTYDAVLFFSPTAVKSFFSENTLPPHTICFAIGHTTGGALRDYTTNEIHIAGNPSAATLLQTAIDHLENLYNRNA